MDGHPFPDPNVSNASVSYEDPPQHSGVNMAAEHVMDPAQGLHFVQTPGSDKR